MNDIIVKRHVHAEVINIAIVMSVLLALCLVVPLATQGVTAHPANQYVIGSAVNAALVYAGLRFRRTVNVFAVLLVPSVCVAVLGHLGINAIFMMYMIPFIWLGNMAIVFTMRVLAKGQNTAKFVTTSTIAVVLKATLIFGGFMILNSFGVFPTPVARQLSVMMGMVQVITATIGCAVAYGVTRLARV